MSISLSLLWSSKRKFHFLVLTSAMRTNKQANMILCPFATAPHWVLPGCINLQWAWGTWLVLCLALGIQKLRVPAIEVFKEFRRKDKRSRRQHWVVRAVTNCALGRRDGGWPSRSEMPWVSEIGGDNYSLHLFGASFKPGMMPGDSHPPSPHYTLSWALLPAPFYTWETSRTWSERSHILRQNPSSATS